MVHERLGQLAGLREEVGGDSASVRYPPPQINEQNKNGNLTKIQLKLNAKTKVVKNTLKHALFQRLTMKKSMVLCRSCVG